MSEHAERLTIEFVALPTKFTICGVEVAIETERRGLDDEQEERVVRCVVASSALSGIDARPHLGLPPDWEPGRSLKPRRDPGAPRDAWELGQIHERLRLRRVRSDGEGVHLPSAVRNAAFLSALCEASR